MATDENFCFLYGSNVLKNFKYFNDCNFRVEVFDGLYIFIWFDLLQAVKVLHVVLYLWHLNFGEVATILHLAFHFLFLYADKFGWDVVDNHHACLHTSENFMLNRHLQTLNVTFPRLIELLIHRVLKLSAQIRHIFNHEDRGNLTFRTVCKF